MGENIKHSNSQLNLSQEINIACYSFNITTDIDKKEKNCESINFTESTITKNKSDDIEDNFSKKHNLTLKDLLYELMKSPRELWIIYFLKFAESYAYFIMSYTLILFLSDEFHYGDQQAGWVFGILGMLTSIYGLIMGFIIDRIGVRNALILGSLLVLFSRLALSVITSHVGLLFILFTVLPIGGSLGIPVMQIGVRRYTNDKTRSIAFSIFYVIMNVAAMIAAPMVDVFRHFYGNGTTIYFGLITIEITMYGLIFLSAAFASFIVFTCSFLFIRDFDIETGKNIEKKELSTSNLVKDVVKRKEFWQFLLLIVLLIGVRMVYRHLDATFPKFMVREFGPHVLYGSIIAINPLIVIALVPLIAPFSYYINPYSQILFGTFITAISPFFLCFGSSYFTAISFVIVLSIGEAIWSPRIYDYTLYYCEKGREGTYMALAQAPLFFATLFSGVLSGWFVGEYIPENGPREPGTMWFLIGFISITSPILLFILRKYIEVTSDVSNEKRILKEEKEPHTNINAKKKDYGAFEDVKS